MAETTVDLRPCPFCNSDEGVKLVSSAEVEGHPNENGTTWWVGHHCEKKNIFIMIQPKRNKNHAVRTWNREGDRYEKG
jgi:hypothetical protein